MSPNAIDQSRLQNQILLLTQLIDRLGTTPDFNAIEMGLNALLELLGDWLDKRTILGKFRQEPKSNSWTFPDKSKIPASLVLAALDVVARAYLALETKTPEAPHRQAPMLKFATHWADSERLTISPNDSPDKKYILLAQLLYAAGDIVRAARYATYVINSQNSTHEDKLAAYRVKIFAARVICYACDNKTAEAEKYEKQLEKDEYPIEYDCFREVLQYIEKNNLDHAWVEFQALYCELEALRGETDVVDNCERLYQRTKRPVFELMRLRVEYDEKETQRLRDKRYGQDALSEEDLARARKLYREDPSLVATVLFIQILQIDEDKDKRKEMREIIDKARALPEYKLRHNAVYGPFFDETLKSFEFWAQGDRIDDLLESMELDEEEEEEESETYDDDWEYEDDDVAFTRNYRSGVARPKDDPRNKFAYKPTNQTAIDFCADLERIFIYARQKTTTDSVDKLKATAAELDKILLTRSPHSGLSIFYSVVRREEWDDETVGLYVPTGKYAGHFVDVPIALINFGVETLLSTYAALSDELQDRKNEKNALWIAGKWLEFNTFDAPDCKELGVYHYPAVQSLATVARIYYQAGQFTKAYQIIQRALRADDDSERKSALDLIQSDELFGELYALKQKVLIEMALSQYTQAESTLNRLIRRQSEKQSKAALIDLAFINAELKCRTGKFTEARKIYADILRFGDSYTARLLEFMCRVKTENMSHGALITTLLLLCGPLIEKHAKTTPIGYWAIYQITRHPSFLSSNNGVQTRDILFHAPLKDPGNRVFLKYPPNSWLAPNMEKILIAVDILQAMGNVQNKSNSTASTGAANPAKPQTSASAPAAATNQPIQKEKPEENLAIYAVKTLAKIFGFLLLWGISISIAYVTELPIFVLLAMALPFIAVYTFIGSNE